MSGKGHNKSNASRSPPFHCYHCRSQDSDRQGQPKTIRWFVDCECDASWTSLASSAWNMIVKSQNSWLNLLKYWWRADLVWLQAVRFSTLGHYHLKPTLWHFHSKMESGLILFHVGQQQWKKVSLSCLLRRPAWIPHRTHEQFSGDVQTMPTEKWIIAPDRLWALGIFIMWHQNSISKMHWYRSILVTWETSFWPITLYHSDCWCVMCSFSWKSVLQALRVIRATDFPLVAVDVHRLAADEAAPTASSWRDDLVTVFV